MKSIYVLPLMLFVLIGSNCSKDKPVADFTIDYLETPCYVPCAVTFISESKHAASLLWDFGDGTQSQSFAPEPKVYDQAGSYEVTLTVSGADGGEDSITKQVEIKQVPTSVKIDRVFIHKLPLQAPGDLAWDPGNEQEAWPDLFFTIQDNRGIRTFENPESTLVNVDTTMLPVRWEFDPPIILNSLNKNYFLEVNDNDSPEPSLRIGFVTFRPSDYQFITSPYPTRLELTKDSTVAINIEMTWE